MSRANEDNATLPRQCASVAVPALCGKIPARPVYPVGAVC